MKQLDANHVTRPGTSLATTSTRMIRVKWIIVQENVQNAQKELFHTNVQYATKFVQKITGITVR